MKKFIKKLAKKTEGFTLVELIVVIAILGVLAGIAVPAYSGYLTKAKDAAVVAELDAIKTACVAAGAMQNPYVEVKYIDVDADATTPAVAFGASSSAATLTDISAYFNIGAIDWDETSYKFGATWNGNTWTAKNS